MNNKDDKKLFIKYEKDIIEIDRDSAKIDPKNSLDWYSLIIGWALAKGLTPDDAHELSIYVRYHTKYC